MGDNQKGLLPNGFSDLLPPEAEREAVAINILMDSFAKFGYQRIKPPLVEFEESLLAPGPGAALAGETFRLMDPVSHRMMGVRADITAQTARIASTRLSSKNRPLRLMYAADVLRTKADSRRIDRQFCQVGCEMIGDDSVHSDVETCVVALQSLCALGVSDVTLDLAVPRMMDKIYNQFGIEEEQRVSLSAALDKKDVSALDVPDELQTLLNALVDVSGGADAALEALASIELPEAARADLEYLQAVYQDLSVAIAALELSNVSITVDPLESRGFEYHSGIGFTLFAHGVRGEMGRGGRYNIVSVVDSSLETATGFTLYMDTVLQSVEINAENNIKQVSMDTNWAEIKKLQEDGYITVRTNDEETS